MQESSAPLLPSQPFAALGMDSYQLPLATSFPDLRILPLLGWGAPLLLVCASPCLDTLAPPCLPSFPISASLPSVCAPHIAPHFSIPLLLSSSFWLAGCFSVLHFLSLPPPALISLPAPPPRALPQDTSLNCHPSQWPTNSTSCGNEFRRPSMHCLSFPDLRPIRSPG